MKRTPLIRKTALRRSGRLRTASPGLAARRREYSKLNTTFAAAHPYCIVAASGVLGDPTERLATETHHKESRYGKKLLDFTKCIRVCRAGHDWIRDNGREARKRGWLI